MDELSPTDRALIAAELRTVGEHVKDDESLLRRIDRVIRQLDPNSPTLLPAIDIEDKGTPAAAVEVVGIVDELDVEVGVNAAFLAEWCKIDGTLERGAPGVELVRSCLAALQNADQTTHLVRAPLRDVLLLASSLRLQPAAIALTMGNEHLPVEDDGARGQFLPGVEMPSLYDPAALLAARLERGWSPAELASKAGVSTNVIKSIERTGRTSQKSIFAVITALDVPSRSMRRDPTASPPWRDLTARARDEHGLEDRPIPDSAELKAGADGCWSTDQASLLVGASYRQVDHWVRRGLVVVAGGGHSGSPRRWTRGDLDQLRVLAWLRNIGEVSGPRIARFDLSRVERGSFIGVGLDGVPAVVNPPEGLGEYWRVEPVEVILARVDGLIGRP